MEKHIVRGVPAGWENLMAPLTWDRHTPVAPTRPKTIDPDLDGLDTNQFEAVEPGMDFGEGEGERTVITTASYDLKPKFTGRAAAIAQLQSIVAKAFAPNGTLGFAVIVGEPGMGKSRILHELIGRSKAQHPGLVVLAGIADENSHAYGSIARALTSRAGGVGGEIPVESRDKIQAGGSEVVPAQRVPEIAHLVAHLLRVPFDASPVVGPLLDSPQRLEARLFMALKRLLTAETDNHPVLIVVENLELCETDTINFLQYLAAGMTDRRVAIVGTAPAALWQRHATFGEGEVAPTKIDLTALTPNEAEELLRELCKQLHEVPAKLVQHVRGMGGSPRAIHELVRWLLASDVIVREGMMRRLDGEKLVTTSLPKTYDDLVAERLRVMEPIERRVIEMASVVGERSWLAAIIALARSHANLSDPDGPTLAEIASSGDHSRLAIVAAVNKLIEREWLIEIPLSSVSGERELRFAYPNLWALTYKGLDENRRRDYHNIVARWLELHPEGRSPAQQEEVGRHLALAGETREAALRYRRSPEVARGEYQNDKAIRLFDRALACLGNQDLAQRLHIWHDLGSVYELIGDFEAALGAFERMLRLSWVAASKTKAAVAFNKMGRVWRRKGDLKLALEYLERGLELFRGTGDGRGIAGSLDDIGKTLHMLGRYDEAYAKITEALARRGKGGDKRAIATSMSRLGDVQQDRGQYESAYNCHKEALELRQAVGDRWGQVVSRHNLAALAFALGDAAEQAERSDTARDASVAYGRAIDALRAIGNEAALGKALYAFGRYKAETGALADGKDMLRDAIAVFAKLGLARPAGDAEKLLATLH